MDPRSEETYLLLLKHLKLQAIKAEPKYKNPRSASNGEYDELNRYSHGLQVLVILECGLFDESYYLSTYKDVASAGADPLFHYVSSGENEGRFPNAVFDPAFYRKQLIDAHLLPCTALYHYAVVGQSAGLRASPSFNPRNYLISNDLPTSIDRPLAHYLWIGRTHGFSGTRLPRLSTDQKVKIKRHALPHPISQSKKKRGVNLIGPLDRVSGLGVSARGYLEAIRMTGFGPIGSLTQKRWFSRQSTIPESDEQPVFYDDAAINLVHMNGDAIFPMLTEGFNDVLGNRYNIAVWYWELPALRPEWQAAMEYFHEFWAPTPFIANTIKQFTAKPVRLVPPYLSYLRKQPPKRTDFQGATHFIYCFDANSILERKNPGLLLDAFLEAFPGNSEAQLTFKITYPDRNIAEIDRLYAASESNPSIHIIDGILSDAALHDLIASASAYISPHRSEGLGLTIIEAMGFGTPVIATPFGGPDHLITPDAAWPLDYKLIELEGDYFPYPKGYVWADPDKASLISALVEVAEYPASALARANIARDRVQNYFASSILIETYKIELERISTSIGL